MLLNINFKIKHRTCSIYYFNTDKNFVNVSSVKLQIDRTDSVGLISWTIIDSHFHLYTQAASLQLRGPFEKFMY